MSASRTPGALTRMVAAIDAVLAENVEVLACADRALSGSGFSGEVRDLRGALAERRAEKEARVAAYRARAAAEAAEPKRIAIRL